MSLPPRNQGRPPGWIAEALRQPLTEAMRAVIGEGELSRALGGHVSAATPIPRIMPDGDQRFPPTVGFDLASPGSDRTTMAVVRDQQIRGIAEVTSIEYTDLIDTRSSVATTINEIEIVSNLSEEQVRAIAERVNRHIEERLRQDPNAYTLPVAPRSPAQPAPSLAKGKRPVNLD